MKASVALGAVRRAEREKERELKCVTNVKALLDEATASVKAGELQSAEAGLADCESVLVDPKAIKLLASVRSAQEAAQAKRVAERLAAEKKRKKSEGVRLGMTQEDVVASSWGRPRTVNKTTNRYGTHEQWVYDGGYLYFDDGLLTSIQH